MIETIAAKRLKRIKIRSWRRGTKEMDMILGPYADARLGALTSAELEALEALMGENDQDLYRWFSGAEEKPERHLAAIARISAFHGFA